MCGEFCLCVVVYLLWRSVVMGLVDCCDGFELFDYC